MDKRNKAATGRIFNLERYATEDGPGIRTLVFFKGCGLHCLWCANPESQRRRREILYFKNKCGDCGLCFTVCPQGAILRDAAFGYITDHNRCNQCGSCVKYCIYDARSCMGEDITLEGLLEKIKADRSFYESSGGGVTFSGGEPFLQGEFLTAIAAACKSEHISTAVETCGYAPWAQMVPALPHLDYIFYDIKHRNDELHRRFTGVDTHCIDRNLQRLDSSEEDFTLIVRTPFIPGFNGDEKSIRDILAYLRPLQKLHHLELLPYHRLGTAKYEALGLPYQMGALPPGDKKALAGYVDIGKEYGIAVTVGAAG